MKLQHLLYLCFAILLFPGCLATAPYWIRRAVIHDDVVYVKSNNTLYRRYEPEGIRLPGNKALLDVEKEITSGNPDIIVFPNLAAAEASGIHYELGPILKKELEGGEEEPEESQTPQS